MTIAAFVANVVFVLLEVRTRNAHRALMERGSRLEDKYHLSIEDGVYSSQATRGSFPAGHGIVLIAAYVVALLLWLTLAALSAGRYFPLKCFTG